MKNKGKKLRSELTREERIFKMQIKIAKEGRPKKKKDTKPPKKYDSWKDS